MIDVTYFSYVMIIISGVCEPVCTHHPDQAPVHGGGGVQGGQQQEQAGQGEPGAGAGVAHVRAEATWHWYWALPSVVPTYIPTTNLCSPTPTHTYLWYDTAQ